MLVRMRRIGMRFGISCMGVGRCLSVVCLVLLGFCSFLLLWLRCGLHSGLVLFCRIVPGIFQVF